MTLDLVKANRDWLADEASYEERYYASHSTKAEASWRKLAQARLAARKAANGPWPKPVVVPIYVRGLGLLPHDDLELV